MVTVPDPSQAGSTCIADGIGFVDAAACVTHFESVWLETDGCWDPATDNPSPAEDAIVSNLLQQLAAACPNPQAAHMTCNTDTYFVYFTAPALASCVNANSNFDDGYVNCN